MTYDTIIVGMGAAGCSAAAALCSGGRRVLGLEAQDRVGGRVCTVPLGDGVVELGAEWIHGESPNVVFELAKKHSIRVVSQNLTVDVLKSDGTETDRDLMNELVNFTLAVVDDPPKKPEPFGEYATRRITEYIKQKHPYLLEDTSFLPQLLQFLELLICNYDPSDSWNDITTHNNYRTVKGDLHMSWHKIGYRTLFDVLLNTYNNGPGLPSLDLRLQKVVSKISYPQEREHDVVVSCDDGSVYKARNVIVTVSVGVLKAKHKTLFSPPLPESKISPINSIDIGVMNKIEVLFPHIWWPANKSMFGFLWREEDRACFLADDEWVTKILGATTPKGSDRVLTLWTSGSAARQIETLPVDVLKMKAMALLRRFMGRDRNIPEPVDIVRSTWHSNPYTLGSYSYDNTSAPLHPRARAQLAAPLCDVTGAARVLFAGEATHDYHFSTVHGAIETGRREAARLLPNSKL